MSKPHPDPSPTRRGEIIGRKPMSRLVHFFATLRWRLMLSFFVTALMALVILEGTFVIVPGVIALVTPQHPTTLVSGLEQLAPQASRYLSTAEPDRAGLVTWLHTHKNPITNLASGLGIDSARTYAVTPGQNAELVVINANGQPLAMLTPTATNVGNLTGIASLPAAHAVITAALADSTDASRLLQTTPDGRTVVAAPIKDSAGNVRGALL